MFKKIDLGFYPLGPIKIASWYVSRRSSFQTGLNYFKFIGIEVNCFPMESLIVNLNTDTNYPFKLLIVSSLLSAAN